MVSLEKILKGNKSRLRKNLIAGILSAPLVLSGCGGGGDSNSNDTNTNPTIVNTTAPEISGIDISRVDGKPILYTGINNDIRDVNGPVVFGVNASDVDDTAYGKNPLVDMKLTDQNGNVLFDGACNYDGGTFYSCTSLDLSNLGGNSITAEVTATDSIGTPVLSSNASYQLNIDKNTAGNFTYGCDFVFAGVTKDLSPTEIITLAKPAVAADPEGDVSNISIAGVYTLAGVLVSLINGRYSLGDRYRVTFQNKDEYGASQVMNVTAYSDPGAGYGDFSTNCGSK